MSARELITEHLDLWSEAVIKKSSSGRGSNGKVELTGVKKLRELILELAVHGKLVEQYRADTPAHQLLERIAEHRKELISAKKVKSSKQLPLVAADEAPSQLPAGWAWTRLGSIAEINPRNAGDDTLEASFIPMPLITTSYHGEHGDKPRNWGEIKKGYSHFANGDVGLAKITPCFENSKAAVFRNLRNGIGAGTTELHVARPLSPAINPYFLLLFLKSPRFLTDGEKVMTGSAGQKRVPKGYFSETPLPLPPEEEQHRIVQKVDELMALCDRLEQQTSDQLEAHETLVDTLLGTLTQSENAIELADNWTRLTAHFDTLFTTEQSIDKLKQTILQLAVMGKLVPQDPSDEPAAVLLEKIAAEKAQLVKEKKIKKEKALPPIGEDEKPFALPAGWAWSRLGNLAQYQKGYAFKSKEYLECGLMITKIQNLTENHIQNSLYIAPERASEFSQYLLHEGDIVMTTVGSWFSAPISAVGRSFLINKLFDNSLLNQNAVRIRAWKGLAPMYLYACVNTPIYKNYLVHEAQGTANQASITQESIKKFLLCVPPKNEQHRIVAKVDQLIALCDQLKARLNQASEIRCQLSEVVIEKGISA